MSGWLASERRIDGGMRGAVCGDVLSVERRHLGICSTPSSDTSYPEMSGCSGARSRWLVAERYDASAMNENVDLSRRSDGRDCIRGRSCTGDTATVAYSVGVDGPLLSSSELGGGDQDEAQLRSPSVLDEAETL